MFRLVILLILAILLSLFLYGIRSGAVTFQTSSPMESCACACSPATVIRVALQIDPQGVLEGYSCECSP